ncbi:hypothetical protein [Jiangella asiatica]|uniref:hypothetical protein n=1 Tax=Jiangella asiatica TaxID=2530372 RepID=UPI0013A5E864|nr:hypothetical protein [Jiangella asiatica]
MDIVIMLLLAAVIVAAIAAARWADSDGGPRHDPLPRAEDEWSPNLPNHPYAG